MEPSYIIDQLTGEMIHTPEKLVYVGNVGPHTAAAYLGDRIMHVPIPAKPEPSKTL